MKRLFALAAFLLASTAAQAQYTFDYGGRTIRIDPDRGTVSIPGVYVGMGDKIPLGAAMNKGLTIKTGQTHVQAYTKPLLKLIEDGKIDPSFVVTHPAKLEDAPAMYKKFRDKEGGVIKVVLHPGQ